MIDLIEQLADTTIKTRSDPSPIAFREPEIVADIEHQTEQETTFKFVRSDKGDLFDPDIHAVDANGQPVKTKTGKFAKKRGRKTGETTKPNTGQIAAVQTSKQLGRATAFMIFSSGQALFGEEWKPIKDKDRGIDEETTMIDAWSEYYLLTGKKDLPPWAGISVVCCAYALPRLSMPKTQERLSGFRGMIQRWKENRKNKKDKR